MSGFGLPGREIREFRFPEAQDIRLDANDFTNLTDPEKKLIGNLVCGHEL
jgi:hypothetical protein